ncbi:acyltransferase family protein [Enterovirga rhinocerotis]|uniref:Peptidoglycan/LPS O-acetylase OafA/YrhL n=1 Tax=Enterovirga rhinocerotis TaxID=1339210 RepID=A0A4R7C8N7_9HYPH|nr:acyltransferase [Enterovirga rhinocerotis]TDR95010.1 peptidoglycan/LPS O-acetylase OafA/YrhL [Enterovirga rhinocerotis]
MSAPVSSPATAQRSLYEPGLDGLRLVAFLAVFLHHLPGPTRSLLAPFHSHGWSGVELFFAISSFLLFRLLDAEYERTGQIGIGKFFTRRLLRIYPLMMAFSLAMFVLLSNRGGEAIFRLLGLATMTDNIITVFAKYNVAIPFSGHLWTLGFEFQIYLCLPFLFLAWKRWGTARFLAGLGLFWALAILARVLVTAAGYGHPLIWVVPIMQPDAILAGIVLATGATARLPRAVWPALFVVSLLAFLLVRPPWAGVVPAILSYPLIALASVSLMQCVRTIPLFGRVFGAPIPVYLGTISFGLYVFHLLGIGIGVKALMPLIGVRVPETLAHSAIVAAVALAATLLLSAISYRWLEMPFLRLKDRFSTVHGRAALSEPSPADAMPAQTGAARAPER